MTARELNEWQLYFAINTVGEDADNIRTALLIMPHIDPKKRSRYDLSDINPLIPKPEQKRLNATATETAFDTIFGLVDADGRVAGKTVC